VQQEVEMLEDLEEQTQIRFGILMVAMVVLRVEVEALVQVVEVVLPHRCFIKDLQMQTAFLQR
jgi:hypothetical protein